ncbi:hypothetical protein [Oscillibacter sp.]|jgi:Kef-type K+ transport system membrane component KefB|uniref:hypothetical protein n=1 Tax=Oscillibacter sp. TaxID=1945593 RepID=UPI00216FA74B|nr:hypothetical protein [Oscillibacter sp.]MCI9649023.1 hypothetical protein [Oscillibacter sp.]
MVHWKKTLLGFALLGLALLVTASILLMWAPSHLYGKLALFIGGLLLSVTAMALQVRAWRRQGVQEERK